MSMSDDSQPIFAPIAAAYGVPVVVAAFIFQPTISALGEDVRNFLYLVCMVTLGALALLFAINPRSWIKAVVAGAVFILFALAWDKAVALRTIADRSNERRCLAIQKDMLSARPRRADSPDLFQALGCRPQGEGNVYAPPAKRG